MTFRRVQRILPLLVLAGVAMPVQAEVVVEPVEASDCPTYACLEVSGVPTLVVADEAVAAVMALHSECPAALLQALEDGSFQAGSAAVHGCADGPLTFFKEEGASATFLTPHQDLLTTSGSTHEGPSCIELLYENLYQLPGVRGLPSLFGVIDSVVIVDYRCPTLSLVMYLIEGGIDTHLQLLGYAVTYS